MCRQHRPDALHCFGAAKRMGRCRGEVAIFALENEARDALCVGAGTKAIWGRVLMAQMQI